MSSSSTLESASIKPLTGDQQRRGMHHAYAAQACGMVYHRVLAGSAVGVLFIKYVGGNDLQAMLLAAIVNVTMIVQIPISLLIAPKNGKRFMLRAWTVGAGVLAAGFVVVSWLPRTETSAWLLLGFLLCAMVCTMAGSTFWWPLLHDVVPANRRGRFFARLRVTWNLAVLAVVVAAAAYLGDAPTTGDFQAVLLFTVLLLLLRNGFVSRIPQGPGSFADVEGDAWHLQLKSILRRPGTAILLFYITLVGFFSALLTLPLVLYMEKMGFPTKDNVLVYGCSLLGTLISLVVTGKMIDRYGTKRTFLLGQVALILTALCVTAAAWLEQTAAMWVMSAAMVLSGGALAAVDLSFTAELFHRAEIRRRALFLSVGQIVNACAMAVSPALAALAVQSMGADAKVSMGTFVLNTYQAVFLVSVAGLIAAFVAWRKLPVGKAGT